MQHVISTGKVTTNASDNLEVGIACRLRPAIIGLALWTASILPATATDYSATMRDLGPYVTNQLQATGAASLALVLMDGNQVVWATGFGLADPVAGRPADADTIYGIGSVSKTFAALAAMRLLDRDALNLDAPVTDYVPAFAFHSRFPGDPAITARLLMNHQSGLPGDYIPYAQTTVPDLRYGAIMLESLADEYPVVSPNFLDSYNNNGFTLLESVVAALSGTTFVAQVAADVFQPLSMAVTGFQLSPNRYTGTLARSMIGTNAYPDEIVNVHASGGMFSSANDMGRVLEMLLGGGEFRGQQFLSANTLATMLTFQGTNLAVASSDRDSRFGLGWDNVADPKLAYAGRACFKGGDTSCFHSHLEIMPEHGLGVATMCNGGRAAQNVGQQALMLALRDKFGIPLPTNAAPFPDSPLTNAPPLPWEQLAGYYTRENGLIHISASNGCLSVSMDAYDPASIVYTNLAPHANGWFWETGNTSAQIGFSNVQDHLLLMSKNNKGQYWNTAMIGERITPLPVSAAWRERALSAWIYADLSPFDLNWATDSVKPVTLYCSNGFLFFQNFSFAPTNDSLVFPYICARNDAGALKVVSAGGEEWLRLRGCHFRAVDRLPLLASPGVVEAALVGDTIGWYRIPRSGSGRLELNLAGAPRPQLRVLDAAFNLMPTIRPTAGRALVAPTGDVFVAVTRGTDGGNAYTLQALWRRVAGDYDGDGKADPALYGSAEAVWDVAYSATGYAQKGLIVLGNPGAMTAAEDYDGDGKTDPAVYRAADGLWTISLSGNGYAVETIAGFGAANAVPVAADYDGDGKADPACYRAANGLWVFKCSDDGYAPVVVQDLGGPDWAPAPADYDGDGKTDPAVYRAADGLWTISLSGNGYAVETIGGFGAANAVPVAADYDGDGKADPACYRAADGLWVFKCSASGYVITAVNDLGGPDWTATPADYDGDGKIDPTCYRRADGQWMGILSAGNYTLQTLFFGGPSCQPAR